MNLFARAYAGLNLTPAERAFLKLLQGFLLAGLVSAAPIVAQALASQPVDWPFVARAAAAAFAVAFLLAVAKYFGARGDKPLATLAIDAAQLIQVQGRGPAIPPAMSDAPAPSLPGASAS